MNITEKISKNNVEDIINLTPLQEGMLYHYLQDSDTNEYFEQLSLNVSGKIDYELFKSAWAIVCNANEILRTIFRWNNISNPVQIILKNHEIPINYVDLSLQSKNEKEQMLVKLKIDDKNRKIDIRVEPFRITLVKLSEELFEMIISNHHIIIDGWSNGIILKEFMEVYQSLNENKRIEIKEKRKFKDFVKWIQKKNKDEQAEYWTKYLEGFDTKSSIPTNFSYRNNYKREIKNSNFKINPSLIDRINNFTLSHNFTFASVLYCAWGILLQKYNNSDDVIFGTAVSGRNPEIIGIEEMVGLFINTLPLRIKNDPQDSAIDLLKRININLRERAEFESTPLIDISSKYSNFNQDSNLFDSIMVIENYPIDEDYLVDGNLLKINSYSVTEETNFDFSLQVILFKSKVELVIQYNKNLIDSNTISELKSHFINIVEDIIQFPNKIISQINYLSAQESKLLVDNFMSFSSGEYNPLKWSTLQEQLNETLNINNGDIAIEYLNRKISYAQLERESNIIANKLISENVKKSTFVGILTDDRAELITLMIGILKAGCVFVPLDSSYPLERLKTMLTVSDTEIVFTDKKHKNYLEHIITSCNNPIKCFEFNEIMLLNNDEKKPEIIYDPEDMLYVFFTSGSTGTPKAVLGRNKSLSHFIQWEIEEFEVNSEIRVSQFTSPCHNPLLRDVFVPLCAGGTICIPESKEKMLDSNYLVRWIEESKISLIHCTPSLFKKINEYDLNDEQFINLKYILLAGERTVPKDLVNWYETIGERIKLVSLYGQTESTLAKMIYYIKAEDVNKNNIPIGKPISFTQIGIFDKDMNLCAKGFKGEIYVRSPFISLGYYNNPNLNNERFIVNPFNKSIDEIIYKTGDIGRLLPDGNIEFLGREDRQTKIRGFRIELNEIENVILLNDVVNETAVVSEVNETGDRTLYAYVVFNKKNEDYVFGDSDISKMDSIKRFLYEKLPDFMVPQKIISIDKLPVNLNGKLDYNALPKPLQKSYKAPKTKTESVLAEIWADILGLDRVGITDRFLENGGHSLNVMSLNFKVQQELNIELPLSLIFSNQTLEEIAKYIDETQEELIISEIEAVEVKDYYPLSGTQNGMFILNQLDKTSTFYNIPYVTKIVGSLDISQLGDAFNLLVKRHESLRTSFHFINGEPAQKIHDDINFKIEIVENLNLNIEKEIKEFIRPFNLEQLPLFRVKLIKVHSNLSYLFFDMHHIITDGVSMTILNRDLFKFYKGEEIPPLIIQYKEYVEWQQKYKSTIEYENQRNHWQEVYNTLPERINLRTDFPRPKRLQYQGSILKFIIDKELSDKVYSLAKQMNCTPFIILFAAYNILLQKYSNQSDLVVGIPIMGRTEAIVQELVGPFINLLALRNKIASDVTVDIFISELKENILKSFENQNFTFEDLVNELNFPSDITRHPIFDTMFVMQNMEHIEGSINDIIFEEYDFETGTTKYDISFIVKEKNGRIKIDIEYSLNLYKEQSIRQFYENFIEVLKTITEKPHQKIKEISITNSIKYTGIVELEKTSFRL